MTKAERLKQDIFKKVREYYALQHDNSNSRFIEGITRVNYAGRVFDEREMVNLIDSSLDFWLTYGKYSKLFEEQFAKYLGVKWAFLVNSGSSANLLAFYALTSHSLKERQIKRGDEVITTAAAFPTTVAPIIQYGAVPVFVDIELETLNIDLSQLKKALSPKTRAVMLAHTLGNPFNIKTVKEFCKQNDLWLIEDNCDALGSKYDGKFTGTFGDIGTSSFYPPHHITMGEGGAVYTSNSHLKKIILSLRDWGRDCWCESGMDNTCKSRFSRQYGLLPSGYDHKYVYSHFGFNLKVTDMQAAIGLAQLEKIDGFAKKRKENYNVLYAGLKNFGKYFILPKATQLSDPSWFGFLLTIKDAVAFSRNEIVECLENNNIQTRNLFAGNLVMQPCMQNLKEDVDYRVIGELKNSDKIMRDSFWVGVYPGMRKDSINYIIKTIKSFIKNKNI